MYTYLNSSIVCCERTVGLKVDPKAGSPIAGLSFAGALDEVDSQALVITMNELWKGYFN